MEQRRHQRYELHLPYQLQLTGSPMKVAGLTRNVSAKGVLLPPSTGLKAGDQVQYSITLPQSGGSTMEVRVACLGTISRIDADGVAATIEQYEFVREAAAAQAATAAA